MRAYAAGAVLDTVAMPTGTGRRWGGSGGTQYPWRQPDPGGIRRAHRTGRLRPRRCAHPAARGTAGGAGTDDRDCRHAAHPYVRQGRPRRTALAAAARRYRCTDRVGRHAGVAGRAVGRRAGRGTGQRRRRLLRQRRYQPRRGPAGVVAAPDVSRRVGRRRVPAPDRARPGRPPGRIAIAAGGARLLLRGVRPGSYPRGGSVHVRLWTAEKLAAPSGANNLAGVWLSH